MKTFFREAQSGSVLDRFGCVKVLDSLEPLSSFLFTPWRVVGRGDGRKTISVVYARRLMYCRIMRYDGMPQGLVCVLWQVDSRTLFLKLVSFSLASRSQTPALQREFPARLKRGSPTSSDPRLHAPSVVSERVPLPSTPTYSLQDTVIT